MSNIEWLSDATSPAERTDIAQDIAKHYGRAARSPRTGLEYARDCAHFTGAIAAIAKASTPNTTLVSEEG